MHCALHIKTTTIFFAHVIEFQPMILITVLCQENSKDKKRFLSYVLLNREAEPIRNTFKIY